MCRLRLHRSQRSHLVLSDLNPWVQKMADRHLSKGKLWVFLRDVEQEIARQKKDVDETTRREEELAHTFIKHVRDQYLGTALNT